MCSMAAVTSPPVSYARVDQPQRTLDQACLPYGCNETLVGYALVGEVRLVSDSIRVPGWKRFLVKSSTLQIDGGHVLKD